MSLLRAPRTAIVICVCAYAMLDVLKVHRTLYELPVRARRVCMGGFVPSTKHVVKLFEGWHVNHAANTGGWWSRE